MTETMQSAWRYCLMKRVFIIEGIQSTYCLLRRSMTDILHAYSYRNNRRGTSFYHSTLSDSLFLNVFSAIFSIRRDRHTLQIHTNTDTTSTSSHIPIRVPNIGGEISSRDISTTNLDSQRNRSRINENTNVLYVII